MTNPKFNPLSRRKFLKLSSAASLGLALSACGLTPASTATPTNTTTYYLNKTECSITTTDSITVTVNDCREPDIFVPSAFSPNGDNQNDVLFVRSNKPVESLEFNVYDRIGELVFSTTDINVGWDGTFNNEKMNNGVFFYYCKAMVDGKEYFLKGDVTLVR